MAPGGVEEGSIGPFWPGRRRRHLYVGPAPCFVSSIADPQGQHYNERAWVCGIRVPRKPGAEPTVQSVYAGWWGQFKFGPEGDPLLDHIGAAYAGAPPVGTDPFLVIQNAKLPASTYASAMTGGAVGGAAGAGSVKPSLSMAGGVGGAIGTGILLAIDNAKRGKFEPVKAQPAAGWFKASGAIVRAAAPAKDAGPAPSQPAVAAPVAADAPVPTRPAHARHLEADDPEGHVWTFRHPAHPEDFGEVRIAFAQGQARAHDARGEASGPYIVLDDKVCIAFDAGRGRSCYYVVQADARAPSAGPTILDAFTGHASPLAVR